MLNINDRQTLKKNHPHFCVKSKKYIFFILSISAEALIRIQSQKIRAV